MFSPFNTKLTGVIFGDCQVNIDKWGHADIGYFRLEREPDNPHDPNAIGVWFLNDRLGYLQRSVAKELAPEIDAGKKLTAKFVCRNKIEPDSYVGLTVKIIEDNQVSR
jgi:hypothetical protein